MTMMNPREPAVAGTFYPSNPRELRGTIGQLLAGAGAGATASKPPKALIVPHAGYVYSGPIAASAYKALAPRAHEIRRVVLLGPSHFVPFRGIALPASGPFRTPLGDVELDEEACAAIDGRHGVIRLAEAHAREHSLEVQLPFLQVALRSFRLVPLAVGFATDDDVAAVIDALWGGPETLVVVSSDLSHHLSYEAAALVDGETARAIERLDEAPLDGDHACGSHPIRGLLRVARERGLRVAPLDRRNSGDTAGDRRRVVGYGAWAFS